jgi:hypothetical protein
LNPGTVGGNLLIFGFTVNIIISDVEAEAEAEAEAPEAVNLW